MAISWDAVTAIATLCGVAFVGWQVLWLRKQIELQNYSDYTKRYADIVLHLPENVNASDFNLDSEIREVRDRTMRYMRAYFDLCFEEWDLQRRRLIDDKSWKVWEGGIRTALKKPAFQQAWIVIKTSGTEYGPEFEQFVKSCFTSVSR